MAVRLKTFARPRDVDEILGRLKALRPDSTRRWGRMTPHQAVCHMRDAFLMGTDAKPVSAAGDWRHRTIMKWVALYAPLPWPAGIDTRPEVDQEVGGTRPAAFADDVAALEAVVRLVRSHPEFFARRSHPTFGALSTAGWLRWSYLHMDHHLRQFGA